MLELLAREIPATDLKPGMVLMDDADVPFAVTMAAPFLAGDFVQVETALMPDGPHDVRTFSRDHQYMRTHGLACIVAWPTYAHAVADAARQMRRRTETERDTWQQWSAVYEADTARMVRTSQLRPFTLVEFKAGTTARIAWMEAAE